MLQGGMSKLMFLMAALAACTTSPTSSGTTGSASCGSDSTLTYANFGAAFMSTNCVSCHSSRARPALTTQADVQANASKIMAVAVDSTKMPQGGSVSADERALLGEWLACGAP